MPDEIREIAAGSRIARIHLPAVYPDEKAAFPVLPNISSDGESVFFTDLERENYIPKI
jgi:hypothetical protein